MTHDLCDGMPAYRSNYLRFARLNLPLISSSATPVRYLGYSELFLFKLACRRFYCL